MPESTAPPEDCVAVWSAGDPSDPTGAGRVAPPGELSSSDGGASVGRLARAATLPGCASGSPCVCPCVAAIWSGRSRKRQAATPIPTMRTSRTAAAVMAARPKRRGWGGLGACGRNPPSRARTEFSIRSGWPRPALSRIFPKSASAGSATETASTGGKTWVSSKSWALFGTGSAGGSVFRGGAGRSPMTGRTAEFDDAGSVLVPTWAAGNGGRVARKAGRSRIKGGTTGGAIPVGRPVVRTSAAGVATGGRDGTGCRGRSGRAGLGLGLAGSGAEAAGAFGSIRFGSTAAE